MLCFHFFGREVIMGRRWRFWPLTGFLTAAVLGTLAHFCVQVERRGAAGGGVLRCE